MYIGLNQMLRLGVTLCTVLYGFAASADTGGSSQSRPAQGQSSTYSVTAQSSSNKSENNQRDEKSEDGEEQLSGQNANEAAQINKQNVGQSHPLTEQMVKNLHTFLFTMMSQWEYGPDETVPAFMASEQEINEALQKVLNRKDVDQSKY
jgi:hypothetical protein